MLSCRKLYAYCDDFLIVYEQISSELIFYGCYQDNVLLHGKVLTLLLWFYSTKYRNQFSRMFISNVYFHDTHLVASFLSVSHQAIAANISITITPPLQVFDSLCLTSYNRTTISGMNSNNSRIVNPF